MSKLVAFLMSNKKETQTVKKGRDSSCLNLILTNYNVKRFILFLFFLIYSFLFKLILNVIKIQIT